MDYIGRLVKKFESGTKGCDCISQSGFDCGASYGTYQLTWRFGNALAFFKRYYADKYPELKNMWVGSKDVESKVYPGSWYSSDPDIFSALWRRESAENPEQMEANEWEYICEKYYESLMMKLVGFFNPNTHSRAMQECMWSWAVNRGASGAYLEFSDAMRRAGIKDPSGIEPERLMNLCYDKRHEVKPYNRFSDSPTSERMALLPYIRENPLPYPGTNPGTGNGLYHQEEEVTKMQKVKRYQTRNGAYACGRTIAVKGGMIHSYGCPQPNPDVLAEAWDSPSANACVHLHIGATKAIATLPYLETKGRAARGWHCASGPNGSGNNTHISAEMTEPSTIRYAGGANWVELGDGSNTKAHVLATYKNAVSIYAEMCKFHGLNPQSDGVILSHHEGHLRGIASNHGDVEHIWNRFGLTMAQFRKDIAKAMDGVQVDFGGSVDVTDTSGQKVNRLSGTVKTIYQGEDGLNVRTSPDYGDNVDQVVGAGEVFTVTGISADEKWYRLKSGLFITSIPAYVEFHASEEQKQETGDGKYFRVRQSWEDAGSQIGAFKNRDNAVELCKQNTGYRVYDPDGKEIYPCTGGGNSGSFMVRVDSEDLRIRKGPGTTYDYWKDGGKPRYTGASVFTIVKTADGPGAGLWGLLKSYEENEDGWISMDYASKLA